MRRYAYAWITLASFLITIVLHWVFGWFTIGDDAGDHGVILELTPYLNLMGRDTFENWQSEFLQLLWPVIGLAYFLYVGSPASREIDDRMKARVDELVGKARGEALITEIDATHDRHSGHGRIHSGPAFNG